MDDLILDPAAPTVIVEPPDPRSLTPDEADSYAARLGIAGFGFTVNDSGFDVAGEGEVFNYRYDGSAATAVELMERICSERGA